MQASLAKPGLVNHRYQWFVAFMLSPLVTTTISLGNGIGVVAGMVYWYGGQLLISPWWRWLFIPDSPLCCSPSPICELRATVATWAGKAPTMEHWRDERCSTQRPIPYIPLIIASHFLRNSGLCWKSAHTSVHSINTTTRFADKEV